MTTNAVRGAILVAAVIVGALVIANAFPTAGALGPAPVTGPSTSPSAHPTPSPKKTHVKLDCSSVLGTQLAVENATSTAGLAAATATRLQAAGYKISTNDIGNAPSTTATTVVYFRSNGDRTAARCIRKRFFKGANVHRLPSSSSLSSSVQVAVYLGADYAAKHPVH